MKPQDDSASESFLSAFTRAQAIKQQQNSPLYLAQVAEAQKRVQQMGFEMQNQQLDLETRKARMEDIIAGKQTMAEQAAILGDPKMDPSDPATVAALWRAQAKNPTPAGEKGALEGQARYEKAQSAKAQENRWKLAAQSRIEAAKISAGKGSPEERKAATLTKLQKDLEDATKGGNTDAITEAQRALDNFMVFGPQSETTTIETPGGPTVTTTKGPVGAATSKAAIEKRISTSQETYDQLKETIAQINPSTVGPVGKIREEYETVANMLNPGSVAPVTTEARQNMRITIQRLLSSFKEAVGGRMNIQEQNMLKQIGDVTGWMESADTARANLGVLLALEGSRAVRDSKRLKKAAPDWALKAMTERQIAAGNKDGWLTDDEAMRWFDLHKPPTQ